MPRLFFWTLITLGLTLAVGLLAPHQLGVTLYKISLVSLAAVLGYWIDRSVFYYARPHQKPAGCSYDEVASIRRAIVMAAVILAIALGA